MQTISIGVAGMSCGGCVARLSAALKQVPGVRLDAVAVGSATVSYEPSTTSPAAIAAAVQAAGYSVREAAA